LSKFAFSRALALEFSSLAVSIEHVALVAFSPYYYCTMLARLGPEVSHSEITPGPPQPAVRQAQPDRTNKGLSALSNSTTSAAPVRIFPDPTLPGAGGHGEGRRAAHRSSSLGPFDVYATQPSGGTPRDDSHLKCTSSLLPPPASAAPARLQSTTIVLGHSLLVPDPSAHFSQRSRNRDISNIDIRYSDFTDEQARLRVTVP
jgi:hypothetical protein